MLHVALQAYRGGNHVTVFGNMPDTFAGGTLDVRQIGTAIPVRTWGSTLLAGAVGTRPTMLAGAVVTTLVIAPANIPTVLAASPATGDFTVAWCTRAVLPLITVHCWRVWGSLDWGCPNIKSADAWACNVPHARLCIKVNALGETVDT
jgi:hypothetical protein